MWLVLTANWIGSLVAIYLYATAKDESKKKLLVVIAFVAWFSNAAYLSQQPFTVDGYLREISILICEDKGLATLDSFECKNEVVRTIIQNERFIVLQLM
jgi:hypothetical protein